MDFDKWSFEKRKQFLKSLRYKDDEQIYHALKAEGIEIFKSGETDFLGMTKNGVQYYFAIKPLSAQNTKIQKEMKKKYKDKYILIVRG